MGSKIAMVGDFSPVGRASAAFASGDGDSFFESIGSAWNDANYRILNLECPLVEADTPIGKAGPCLSCYSETAGGVMVAGSPAKVIAQRGAREVLGLSNDVESNGDSL